MAKEKLLLPLLMRRTWLYSGGSNIWAGCVGPPQSTAVKMYCIWVGAAQGNGPPGPAHLGPIPAEKLIHKEMGSGNVPTGRTCSSFQVWAQLPQGPGTDWWRWVCSAACSFHGWLLCPHATHASCVTGSSSHETHFKTTHFSLYPLPAWSAWAAPSSVWGKWKLCRSRTGGTHKST